MKKSDADSNITGAHKEYVEKNGLVVQIAKIIDSSAFSIWYDGTSPNAERHPFTTDQLYHQARAISMASEVIKLIIRTNTNLKEYAIQDEMEQWVSLLDLKDENLIKKFTKDIREKYKSTDIISL